jgi:hypothetical protein
VDEGAAIHGRPGAGHRTALLKADSASRYRHRVQIPPTFDAARRVLAVRPAGALPLQIRSLQLGLQQAAHAADVVQPIVADVCVGPYLDLPDGDVPVSAGMLAQWGAGLPHALDAAVTNGFGQSVPQAQHIESVHRYRDVRFAATALLRPELIRGLPVDGDPVVLVPTVGNLIVGGTADHSGLTFMARIADRILESDRHTVSIQPLVLHGFGWAPFDWPAPTRPHALALRRRWDTVVYGAQRPLLQEHYERTGAPHRVAELALAAKDGDTLTYTTLTEGVPTVLPIADVVVLVRSDGQSTRRPMERLLRIPGLLAPVPDSVPPLVFATGFPAELTR